MNDTLLYKLKNIESNLSSGKKPLQTKDLRQLLHLIKVLLSMKSNRLIVSFKIIFQLNLSNF